MLILILSSFRLEELPTPTKKLPPESTPYVYFTGFESLHAQQYIKVTKHTNTFLNEKFKVGPVTMYRSIILLHIYVHSLLLPSRLMGNGSKWFISSEPFESAIKCIAHLIRDSVWNSHVVLLALPYMSSSSVSFSSIEIV